VATDNDGNVLTYNGTSWSSATSEDSTRTVHGVSCISTSFCAAIDTSGYATSYNGSSWSTPADIDGTHALEAVSCISSSYCVATDNDGNVLTYNGTSWSADQDVDSTRTLNAISCATNGSCIAVDASGYAVAYAWSTATSQFTWDISGSLALLLSDSSYDYIYGPSEVPVDQLSLATSTPTYMTFTQTDSTWLTTNAAGDETGFWGYDAFGNLAFGTPTSAFGYAGQNTDASTGLSDMRARWYDAGTGEFETVDPDVAETDAPYAYAGDDPVNEGDPTGLHKCNGDPLTWAGCALNVADRAIPRLIESVSWGWGPKVVSDPCDEAWTLTVNPTTFSRALWFSALGPGGLLKQAWSQTLNLANPAANSAPPLWAPRPVADTPSDYHQFECHWLGVREVPGRAFHLQTWFPNRSVLGEIGSDCNPPSAFHNPVPGT
jgi:RHS repeat-associated protein